MQLFFSLCATLLAAGLTAQTAISGVVINEFVASNDSVGGFAEPDGGYGDYVELYNDTDAAVDLSGANLSDDYEELDKWAFPAGTSIAGAGYLIVWTDGDEDQTGIHTSYSLKKDGEELVLSQNGTIVDSIRFGEQETNVATARRPDGTGAFIQQEPTPNETNGPGGVAVYDRATVVAKVYPNPATAQIEVELPGRLSDREYTVFDATGRRVLSGNFSTNANALRLDVQTLPPGQYQLLFDGGRAAASFQRR